MTCAAAATDRPTCIGESGARQEGRLVAWQNHIVGQSIAAGTPFEAGIVTNGVDSTSVEGAQKLPYAIPNMKVELTTTQAGAGPLVAGRGLDAHGPMPWKASSTSWHRPRARIRSPSGWT